MLRRGSDKKLRCGCNQAPCSRIKPSTIGCHTITSRSTTATRTSAERARSSSTFRARLPSKLVVALGKSGNAYLIDRGNLGGIGTSTATDGISNAHVAGGEIINSPATITTPSGTFVLFHGHNNAQGVGCKTGAGDLVALELSAASPPKISVPWCAASNTQGSPMITTSDGTNDAIVWEVGNHLNGWNVSTGQQVYTGTDTLANVRKFELADRGARP